MSYFLPATVMLSKNIRDKAMQPNANLQIMRTATTKRPIRLRRSESSLDSRMFTCTFSHVPIQIKTYDLLPFEALSPSSFQDNKADNNNAGLLFQRHPEFPG